jgi:hypothetical protein
VDLLKLNLDDALLYFLFPYKTSLDDTLGLSLLSLSLQFLFLEQFYCIG